MISPPYIESLTVTERFQYRPIESPDEIRMLEILSGEVHEPIRIRLSHHPLEDLPKCEGLSYVWGSGIRDQDIICEDKILKGTPNLLMALKKLRNRTREGSGQASFLWIDAICINQADDEEKIQQVQLMRDIYRSVYKVLIWIGEERPMSAKAFEIIHLLDQAARSLMVPEYGNVIFFVPNTTEITNGVKLEDLPKDPAWPDVLDLLAGRAYFSRLWTVQEVALSDEEKTQVLCGNITCPWLVFYNAATLVQNCGALSLTIETDNLTLLNNVGNLKAMQTLLKEGVLTLFNCIGRTEQQQLAVTVIHDRLFSLIGMVRENVQKSLSHLNYEKSPQELFQIATAVMVLESQLVNHLSWLYVLGERDDSKIPSWVGFYDFEPQYRLPTELENIYIPPQRLITFEDGNKTISNQDVSSGVPISFSNFSKSESMTLPMMVTEGFIFDEIVVAFPNLSTQNFQSHILDAYRRLLSLNWFEGRDETIDALWKAISMHDGRFATDEQYSQRKLSFVSCLSSWILEDLGITSEVVNENKILESLHPEIAPKFREHVESNGAFKQGDLEYYLENASLGLGAFAKAMMTMFLIYRENNQPAKHYGRSVFFGKRMYIGIGPMGDNRLGGALAVKVGDKIAILAGLKIPVILRPDENGHYRFVGTAHVPGLIDNPCFEPGSLPEVETIRIR